MLKTSGVAEYVEIMAEHKLGLWGRVTQSVLERDVLIGGRELIFSFIKAFNGAIVIKSLLYEYAKAVLQHEEVV